MQITASDSPDPVLPDGNITYAVNVTNGGPNAATNAHMSVVLNGTLLYQSITVPAGWSCPSLAIGYGASFTCTAVAFAPTTQTFTVVLKAGQAQFGSNDQTINQLFTANSDNADPNNGNNAVTVSTFYDAPNADMQITASDSPDPVAPDGNITYTVNVTNAGPDATTNATMSVVLNNTLLYQSITVPAGWSCPSLAVGYGASFTCTASTLAASATSVFTVVLKAAKSQFGSNDQTINQLFTSGSAAADPNNANNAVTVSTFYDAPNSDMQITASDSPDPVAPDGNITYTVSVTNAGPDAATNATMSVVLNNTLLYQSITVPAGWSCPSLAVGHGASFTCTASTLAVSATSVFTVVLKAGQAQFGINDQTINEVFTTGSDNADPNNANNAINVSTFYDAPNADVQITASDSPDPVAPDGNITYTVSVTNAGPDAAANAAMSVVLNNTLLYQSITVPAGWSCPSLAVGHGASFTCTASTLAASATSVFTVVLKAGQAQFGNTNQTINETFTAGSGAADPNNSNNAVTVQTTYSVPVADLAAANADSPDPVFSGANITYTQSVTNNGPDAATNVMVSQTLPASVGYVSISAPAGFTCTTPAAGASGTINCASPSLANGATANFTLVVKVLALSGSVTETLVASSSTSDSNNANNSAQAVTTISAPTTADLSITKSTAATSVAAGGSISYTITLTNNGPHNATSVVMTDVLPASLLFQSISAPAGFSCTTPAIGANGTVTCNGASLANGASAPFTLVVTVDGNASGTISNTAGVSAAQTDSTPGNSSATASPVTVNAASADLSLAKTTNATQAVIGGTITYTITLTNNGPDAASSVVVSDVLPSSLLFQSISAPAGFSCTTPAVGASGTISCSAATLANGATATFTLVTRVAAGASGSISNSASVSSATGDPNGGNSSSSAPALAAVSSADVSISKTTNATQAMIGSVINYTLTASNAGPSPATNVVVTDTLPAGLQFVSATPSQGSCSGTTTITCNLGTLASAASATVTLSVRVIATSGSVANSATVAATESDPNAGNNTSSAPSIPVVAAAAESIPTLSEWGLFALIALVGLLGLRRATH